MNQRTACVKFVAAVTEINTGFPVTITTEQRRSVIERLVSAFLNNEIEMSAEGKAKYFGNPTELRKYCVGLLNNWLRKAPELNGNVKYEAKNPGSRQGSSDETLKALRALLKITNDADAKAEIEAAIAERVSEIKPKVEINLDAIPAHLRHLVK